MSFYVTEIGKGLGFEFVEFFPEEFYFFCLFFGKIKELSVFADLLELFIGVVVGLIILLLFFCPFFESHFGDFF